MSEVCIVGYGIVSALGLNKDENLSALINEQTGIKAIKILNTVHKNNFVAGEIHKTNKELAEIADIKNFDEYSRTSLLAIIAAKEAVKISGVNLKDNIKTAFVSATTVGGMDKTELYHNSATPQTNNSFVISDYLNDHTEKVCKILGIKHFATTISTACSSSANAIMLGARLIKSGKYKRVIVGGADALSRFTFNGFNSLMILDKQLCQPFDENRRGLNLGEGAAYLVLEEKNTAKENNRTIYGKVLSYANANDAYHQTASSPNGEGATLAMTQAINNANLKTSDIDYINVHGTGTPNNDDSEGTAIKNIFGDNPPKFSSTKAYTGHTLAAAGAIEAVFSIFSINNGIIFPNLNLKTPIKKFSFSAEKNLIRNLEINTVISNSFGFGGNNTSIIYSK